MLSPRVTMRLTFLRSMPDRRCAACATDWPTSKAGSDAAPAVNKRLREIIIRSDLQLKACRCQRWSQRPRHGSRHLYRSPPARSVQPAACVREPEFSMKALIVPQPGKAEVRSVPEPTINDYQALVRVKAASICN